MSLCNREASVVRLSVCLSVNFAQIATSTTNVTRSLPNLHTMVPRRVCIQGVLNVKVKVKGHVIYMSLCNREASVVRLSVCLSVNFAQIASSTTNVT